MATLTPCSIYQEFFKALLWVEDSENAPNDSDEEEEKGNTQKNNTNQDKWQNPNSSGAPLCCRCNNRHFGECKQGGSGRCFTCGQMRHRIQGPSGYTSTGYGGAYHYQRDAICRICYIRTVDHSDILEDSPRTLMLPLAVLVHRGNLISPVQDEVSKDKTWRYLGRESEAIVEERMSGLSSSYGAE
ncbi:hypothetical protein D8674_000066 [Pyrus ussuriensis x Pyrus communis]|uniref:Uncharacterized protein n=1 Tax=Pyrus ussuriensis x Pyrus communis TaxID=2448454 RepID=A0A5N5F2A2_9ROSA|nr:hypothetical protein D8674_000066 [Pyrus ussuriensis x Pyrus communis]